MRIAQIAVLPVPRPTVIPDSIQSTARSPASCFCAVRGSSVMRRTVPGRDDDGAVRTPIPPLLRPASSDEYDPLPWGRRTTRRAGVAPRRRRPRRRPAADRRDPAGDRRGPRRRLLRGAGRGRDRIATAADATFAGTRPGDRRADAPGVAGAVGSRRRGARRLPPHGRPRAVERRARPAPARGVAVGRPGVRRQRDRGGAHHRAPRACPTTWCCPTTEIAAVREIVDRYADTGRVLTHTIVHPNLGEAELDRMEGWRDALRPSGWKVYTLWDPPELEPSAAASSSTTRRWGVPFLERVRERRARGSCARTRASRARFPTRPRRVRRRATSGRRRRRSPTSTSSCTTPATTSTPRAEEGGYDAVGPRREPTRAQPRRRRGSRPGANVWAELGSTWFLMLRRPREAAHVLGQAAPRGRRGPRSSGAPTRSGTDRRSRSSTRSAPSPSPRTSAPATGTRSSRPR